ncbi:MAG TPA: S1 RNA-binding domain-containing protein, partial [Acidimicrobiales bacterium]|nr:S1 RNA-binding domain-containing protein [Acidimicrobiales bacterium]
MPSRHVVVDGSNLATEGGSSPSLDQLDQAVKEFVRENPDDLVTVVVDATFGHRIAPEERERFEQAELEGDVVSPPAGAIGRGDAFLLRIADKVGAVVLSNDSFQEFHGEYEWLFDKGRLIGGKPVPGVGWIFTPRSPVRGPKSRESLKEAKRKRRGEEPEESGPELVTERPRSRVGERKLQRAIAAAVEEAVEPEKASRKRRRRRRGGQAPSEPLNAPYEFITFIANHQLGNEVLGTVEEFSSHGAFVSIGDARCYVPLSAMGNPPPRSARDSLRKGEKRLFVVQAFDAMRRGIELAIPEFARPAGAPTPETVDAE